MMLWLAWALMATTFCMTWLPGAPQPSGVSFDQSVNEPTFRDVCTKRGKWFRAPSNCFVGLAATKHSGQKSVEFQCTENTGVGNGGGRRRRERISGLCVRCRLNPSCRLGEGQDP